MSDMDLNKETELSEQPAQDMTEADPATETAEAAEAAEAAEETEEAEEAEAAEESEEAEASEPEEEHHHHHHHHHHRRTKWQRFKHKVKRFFRKNRRVLLIVLVIALAGIALIVATLMISTSSMTRNNTGDTEAPGTSNADIPDGPYVAFAPMTTPQPICQAPIYSYVDHDSTAEPRSVQLQYNITQSRADTAMPLRIEYFVNNLGKHDEVLFTTLYLIESEAYEANMAAIQWEELLGQEETTDPFKGADVYRNFDKTITSFTLNNLKTGYLYYYKIVVTLDDYNTLESGSGYFYTVTSPRMITLNGMVNVRDLGGWMRVGGYLSIKQGMIIRGSEFDGQTNMNLLANSESRDKLVTFFNIRTEMDLRGPKNRIEGLNDLGNSVKVFCSDCPTYNALVYRIGDSYDTETEKARAAQAKTQIRDIFKYLADESNYPIYIHDTYGVDKTGTVCALLEAVLGVDEQDIYKDYMMSQFALQNTNKGMYNSMIAELKKMSTHNNLQEGAINYLTSCGVSAEEIVHIKNILLEDAREFYAYEEPSEIVN
ncbi:MAG: tyrosine-protein phosphatase [Clostridia bacterium]|nr:tyrosine-protein phosphatase [Clostridia bacterium]